MDLRVQKRITHPDTCYICKYAGSHILVYPKYKEDQNFWAVFIKIPDDVPRTPIIQGLRSRQAKIAVCMQHWSMVNADWIRVAQDEVDFQILWDAHIERTER